MKMHNSKKIEPTWALSFSREICNLYNGSENPK